MNLDEMTPADFIAQYVIECRGEGLFLPYVDHSVINEWLSVCPNQDELLLVLSDILPEFFRKAGETSRVRSLQGARKLVLSALQQVATEKQKRQ